MAVFFFLVIAFIYAAIVFTVKMLGIIVGAANNSTRQREEMLSKLDSIERNCRENNGNTQIII